MRIFQSTLPLRGATPKYRGVARKFSISIHAPLAGSDVNVITQKGTLDISIHAPLAGSDEYFKTAQDRLTISIHAPLAGSDI